MISVIEDLARLAQPGPFGRSRSGVPLDGAEACRQGWSLCHCPYLDRRGLAATTWRERWELAADLLWHDWNSWPPP